jgi:hypothetical protein
LSQSTVLRMYSFFSRHAVDKKAKGFNSGEEGFPSPGRVAWDLWGGDAGASWSKQKRDQIMNDRMNKSIWAGVFFPADEPALVDIAEEEGAPLDEPIIEEAVVETQVPEIVEEPAQPVEEIVAEENSNTETEEEVIEEPVAVEEVAEEPSEEAAAPEVSEETSAE